jgi:hypothetical protein
MKRARPPEDEVEYPTVECPPEVQRRFFDLTDELLLLTSELGIEHWEMLAGRLFLAITKHRDMVTARRIFDETGPMPPRMRTRVENQGLLDRYARVQPKNVRELARIVAKENAELLPKTRWRGAGSTDWVCLEEHIRDLIKADRDQARRRLAAQCLDPSKPAK